MKDLTTVKQRIDCSGKWLTEEREKLTQWTKYCLELCSHTASGEPSVLNCPQTDTEDDHPILRKEVEAVIQLLKLELRASQQNWSKQVEEKDLLISRQCATRSGRQENDQFLGPSPWSWDFSIQATRSSVRTQSHAEDHTEQTEAASEEDHHLRTGRLQSRMEHHRAELQPKNPLWEIFPFRPLPCLHRLQEGHRRV